jgi:predicted RNA-binding Zn-ribbon protein involved in translation (DUF1610 family)
MLTRGEPLASQRTPRAGTSAIWRCLRCRHWNDWLENARLAGHLA